MKAKIRKMLLTGLLLFVAGCGHWAYLGVHGPSIRQKWDVHANVGQTDAQCLECHHPDNAKGPATPHPEFTGCLKCHND